MSLGTVLGWQLNGAQTTTNAEADSPQGSFCANAFPVHIHRALPPASAFPRPSAAQHCGTSMSGMRVHMEVLPVIPGIQPPPPTSTNWRKPPSDPEYTTQVRHAHAQRASPAMPEIRPPPPTGTNTASTRSRSASSSSAMVPCPPATCRKQRSTRLALFSHKGRLHLGAPGRQAGQCEGCPGPPPAKTTLDMSGSFYITVLPCLCTCILALKVKCNQVGAMVPSLVRLRLSQRCPILLTEMPCQPLLLASDVSRELQRKRMTGSQRLSQRAPRICNAVRTLQARRRRPS